MALAGNPLDLSTINCDVCCCWLLMPGLQSTFGHQVAALATMVFSLVGIGHFLNIAFEFNTFY